MGLEAALMVEMVRKLLAMGSTIIARDSYRFLLHIFGPFLAASSNLSLIQNLCESPVSLL